MAPIKIGVVVGSLRREAFSLKVAKALSERMPAAFEMQLLDIGNLALYNQDYEVDGEIPAPWIKFREQVDALDGVLFVTPEYNRSMPPALKNALDIASRPYNKNRWSGKPCAVVSVSPGSMGGFGANHHLRQSLTCLNMYTMQQPEAYVANIAQSLDKDGNPDERLAGFLQKIADSFAEWVAHFVRQA